MRKRHSQKPCSGRVLKVNFNALSIAQFSRSQSAQAKSGVASSSYGWPEQTKITLRQSAQGKSQVLEHDTTPLIGVGFAQAGPQKKFDLSSSVKMKSALHRQILSVNKFIQMTAAKCKWSSHPEVRFSFSRRPSLKEFALCCPVPVNSCLMDTESHTRRKSPARGPNRSIGTPRAGDTYSIPQPPDAPPADAVFNSVAYRR